MTSNQTLTAIQAEFVNAYLYNGESPEETRKAMGWKERGQASGMLRVPKIRTEIARRKGELAEYVLRQGALAGVSKEMRASLLWEVAQAGAVPGFDKEGNQVLVNPGSTIQAIRELNLMTGAHAPVVSETQVTVTKRNEIEIKASILELQEEAASLIALANDVAVDDAVLIEG